MQAFLAVAWLLLAVAVAVLAYAVVRLRADSAALRRALDDLRAERSPLPLPAPVPEPVAVITQLDTDQGSHEPDPPALRVASVTLGGPLIKLAAFSSGVRRALDEDHRMRLTHAFRRELRRQQKLRRQDVRRRRRAAGAPSGGWDA